MALRGKKRLAFAAGLFAAVRLGCVSPSLFTASGAERSAAQNTEWLIKTWQTEDGLPENSATAMVQTPDGYLWFGTFNGLVRFDGVKFTVFDRQNTPELPSPSIVNLYRDKRGRLWVSTYGGLVVRDVTRWQDLTSGGRAECGSQQFQLPSDRRR